MVELVLIFLIGVGSGILLIYPRVERVSKEASTDTLTGLYNRSLLEKTLGRLLALARRDKRPISVLMIDLNRFKEANDKYGHHFGDEVLRQTAIAMAKSVRKSDFIFRYGGDEFLLILPETTSAGATKTAQKIIENMNLVTLTTPRGGKYSGVDCSVGIASFPEDAKDEMELLAASDEAVYKAKSEKGHIEVATGES